MTGRYMGRTRMRIPATWTRDGLRMAGTGADVCSTINVRHLVSRPGGDLRVCLIQEQHRMSAHISIEKLS